MVGQARFGSPPGSAVRKHAHRTHASPGRMWRITVMFRTCPPGGWQSQWAQTTVVPCALVPGRAPFDGLVVAALLQSRAAGGAR